MSSVAIHRLVQGTRVSTLRSRSDRVRGMSFEAPIPILRMFDEKKAREFYIDWLGFNVDFEHRFEEGLPLYIGISRDACRLHLSEHHGDSTPGSAVRILVSDLEEYHRAPLAKNYKYSRAGLQDQE